MMSALLFFLALLDTAVLGLIGYEGDSLLRFGDPSSYYYRYGQYQSLRVEPPSELQTQTPISADTIFSRELLGNPIYFPDAATIPQGTKGSDFGWQVVSNGNTLLVGADTYSPSSTSTQNQGQVQIFKCSGTTCTIKSTVNNPNGDSGLFGQAVASIGNFAAIGAPATLNQGVVYIYNITSLTNPTKLHTISTPDQQTGGQTHFGVAVTLFEVSSLTGPPQLILAAGDTSVNYGQGRIYFFSVDIDTLTANYMASVQDPSTATSGGTTLTRAFGYPIVQSNGWIATSGQGNYVTPPTMLPATVYVYTCSSSGACSQVGNTIASPGGKTNILFGYMLALQKSDAASGTVATLVAGASKFSSLQGAAYVYKYTTQGQWTLTQTLTPLPVDGLIANFGSGVALSAGTLVVSAQGGNGGLGSLYVYYCYDGACGEAQQIINCPNSNACNLGSFGNNALALSGTATFLAVGARTAYGGFSYSSGGLMQNYGNGAVFIYSTAPTAAPTPSPTNPTAAPSIFPTPRPSPFPTTAYPSAEPTTATPSAPPTVKPTPEPTNRPTPVPSALPTVKPSPFPTPQPSPVPSAEPTLKPSGVPTTQPTPLPSSLPTFKPSPIPSVAPTPKPSSLPTLQPSPMPSAEPTAKPSTRPSPQPSPSPSAVPSFGPTRPPTPAPSAIPSALPTFSPTARPTPSPSSLPTTRPTPSPSSFPTVEPTPEPTTLPTIAPTGQPTSVPSKSPTGQPTGQPTGHIKLAGETQSLINDLTVGKDRTWFWPVLIALLLGLCLCAFICRRWKQFKDTQDNRSPYEVWVEWEQARKEGKPEQFVPKDHVANPRSPRGSLPGQGGRFISQRIVDIIPGLGAVAGSNSPGRRLDPNASPIGGVIRYDASGGANKRPHGSVIELNDLYGRPSDGMANTGGMRALDRLSDVSPNPAVLAGISDDEVKAAAAMALAQRQILAAAPSSSGKRVGSPTSTFGAYNPLIVGLGNEARLAKTAPAAAPAAPAAPAAGEGPDGAGAAAGADSALVTSSALSAEIVGTRPQSTLFGGMGSRSSVLSPGSRLASTRMGTGAGAAFSPSNKVLVAVDPSVSDKTSYLPGTLLQSPESLMVATIRESLIRESLSMTHQDAAGLGSEFDEAAGGVAEGEGEGNHR